MQSFALGLGPNARVGTPAEAAQFGEVVVLSVPWPQVTDALALAGSLEGKVLIDTCNAFGGGPAIPTGLSVGEVVSRLAPGARVVKAYNTLGSAVLATAAYQNGGAEVAIFYSGDDGAAKALVAELIVASGYAPIDVGPLRDSRFHEQTGPLYGRPMDIATAQGQLAALEH